MVTSLASTRLNKIHYAWQGPKMNCVQLAACGPSGLSDNEATLGSWLSRTRVLAKLGHTSRVRVF